MSKLTESLYHVRLLDELAKGDSAIHRLPPLVKLLTTAVYLVCVISFDRYSVSALLPFVFYPMLIFILADLPAAPILKRVLLIEPMIIGIGILNPLLDQQTINLGSVVISSGWLTFFSILIKSSLTVTASILLIATTGIDQLAAALRQIKVPRIFVLQLLLTYRYISVLIEEASRMMRAYTLRAPGQKSLQRKVWGSFIGQLVLRTFDRAQRVYQAMTLRGFAGEYHTAAPARAGWAGMAFLLGWCLLFGLLRIFNLPDLIGIFLTGASSK